MKNSDDVGFKVRKLSNILKRKVDASVNEDLEIFTGLNKWLIGYLAHNADKDIFQKDIEAKFEIRRSTATNMLQLMEKKGLIKRVPVEQDARLKKIILTEKSLGIHAKVQEEIERVESLLVKGLTQEEIESFNTIIQKMINNLDG